MSFSPGRVIAVVPARNEADRIADCLKALGNQAGAKADQILLVINNTTDRTAVIARGLAPVLSAPLMVIETDFPEGTCSAGSARRLGMERAASLAGDGGVLLTTDADGRVPPSWVDANLWHIRAGSDAVAGRAVLDEDEAALLPPKMLADYAEECALADALDELADVIDPDPWDTLPRHTHHSGASIAVRVDAYRRAGGMPAVPVGEDRQFFAALRRADCRIRHAPEIVVTVSARSVGRAERGMADWIRRRMKGPDQFADGDLEPARRRAERLRLRRQFRDLHASRLLGPFGGLALAVALPEEDVEAACSRLHFGEGWSHLESKSPVLRPLPVSCRDVVEETSIARKLIAGLRAGRVRT